MKYKLITSMCLFDEEESKNFKKANLLRIVTEDKKGKKVEYLSPGISLDGINSEIKNKFSCLFDDLVVALHQQLTNTLKKVILKKGIIK